MNSLIRLAKVRSFTSCVNQTMRSFHISQRLTRQLQPKILRMKGEDHFRRMDGLPKEYELIYKFPLHYSVNCGKFTGVFSMGTFLAVKVYNYFTEYYSVDTTGFFLGIAVDDFDFNVLFLGFVCFNAALYRYCHIIPLRIYRHGSQYVAVMPSPIPRYNNLNYFTKGEVKEHFKDILMMGRGVMYKLKNKNIMLLPQKFRKPIDFYEMLQTTDAEKYLKFKPVDD